MFYGHSIIIYTVKNLHMSLCNDTWEESCHSLSDGGDQVCVEFRWLLINSNTYSNFKKSFEVLYLQSDCETNKKQTKNMNYFRKQTCSSLALREFLLYICYCNVQVI